MAIVVRGPTMVPPDIVRVVIAWVEAISTVSPSTGELGKATVSATKVPAGLRRSWTYPLVFTFTVEPVVGVAYWIAGINLISMVEVVVAILVSTTARNG